MVKQQLPVRPLDTLSAGSTNFFQSLLAVVLVYHGLPKVIRYILVDQGEMPLSQINAAIHWLAPCSCFLFI